jgi:hypothetical protein
MEKYLVTIEFRYSDAPKYDYDYDSTSRNKEVTIGVYDDFDDACKGGNKVLEYLETKYKLNPNYNRKERFSKNGGCFGSKRTLISNLAYIQTPFTFYAKITTLKYEDSIEDVIDSVANSVSNYRKYKTHE